MKKIAYVGLGIALLFGVTSVGATTFRAAESYVFGVSETVGDNLYAAGGTVDIAGTADGDVLVAGGDITITGNVTEDLMVAGGNINISGNVGEDLRVLGGDVNISGSVGGEVVGVGGQVRVLQSATVGGDLNLNGGLVRVEAPVLGNVILNADEAHINGVVSGNVKVRANVVKLGAGAVVNGNFDYHSETEASISEGATVLGEINFHQVEAKGKKGLGRGAILAFLVSFAVIKLIAVSLMAIFFVYLWRKWANSFVLNTTDKFWKSTLYGFAALILAPIAAVILFVTVIGSIPAVLILLAYAILLVLATVFAGILTAGLTNKHLLKKKATELEWWKVVLGVLLFQLVKLIPLVGWLVAFVIFLASLGWLVNVVFGVLAKARK